MPADRATVASSLAVTFQRLYGRPPEAIAFAPGRVEFIGNHTDYNGGPVIGAAIDRGVWVAVASRVDGIRRFASDYAGERLSIVEQTGAAPLPAGHPDRWTNYPLGVLQALQDLGCGAPSGLEFLALSNLPVGAGLSSSAAIELASAQAFLALTGQSCDRAMLARIGRHAENHFVGVPCGILDQGVSAFGRPDGLVGIDCRTLTFTEIPFPASAAFWVFNTHAKHSLVDGFYAARHRECQQAAATLGVDYLADARSESLQARGGDLSDTLLRRARHVISETKRVRQVTELLSAGQLVPVGALLTASHRSSQFDFQNSVPELDFLVDVLTERAGVHGARLTGGGFGGAVLALTEDPFSAEDAAAVAARYTNRFGTAPGVFRFHCGPGAHLVSGLTAAV